ncbi:MAG: hypothetical protein H0W10_02245 [Chloroflexi bacterium]|nr:hypothetical protein [Chloroflexota bacterium]
MLGQDAIVLGGRVRLARRDQPDKPQQGIVLADLIHEVPLEALAHEVGHWFIPTLGEVTKHLELPWFEVDLDGRPLKAT